MAFSNRIMVNEYSHFDLFYSPLHDTYSLNLSIYRTNIKHYEYFSFSVEWHTDNEHWNQLRLTNESKVFYPYSLLADHTITRDSLNIWTLSNFYMCITFFPLHPNSNWTYHQMRSWFRPITGNLLEYIFILLVPSDIQTQWRKFLLSDQAVNAQTANRQVMLVVRQT